MILIFYIANQKIPLNEQLFVFTEKNKVISAKIEIPYWKNFLSKLDILALIPLKVNIVDKKVQYTLPDEIKFINSICYDNINNRFFCIGNSTFGSKILYELKNNSCREILKLKNIYNNIYYSDDKIYYLKNENDKYYLSQLELKTYNVNNIYCSNNYITDFIILKNHFFISTNNYENDTYNLLCFNYSGEKMEEIFAKSLPGIYDNKIFYLNQNGIDIMSLYDYNEKIIGNNTAGKEWLSRPKMLKDNKWYIVKKYISANYLFDNYTLNNLNGASLLIPINENSLIILI